MEIIVSFYHRMSYKGNIQVATKYLLKQIETMSLFQNFQMNSFLQ